MNNKLHLLITSVACTIWIIGRLVNVYKYALVGVIYELLWLPLIIGIPVLFVLAIVNWKKENFSKNSLYVISLLLIAATVLITILT